MSGNDYDCTRRTRPYTAPSLSAGPAKNPEVKIIDPDELRALDEVVPYDSNSFEAMLRDTWHMAGATSSGVVQGLFAAPELHTEPGFELQTTLGRAAGTAIGLWVDVGMVGGGGALALGGTGACATGIGCLPGSVAVTAGSAISTAGLALAAEVHGPATYKALTEVAQLHHIATDKHSTYTDRFAALAKRAGLTSDELLQSKANLREIPEHAGRHSRSYHDYIEQFLVESMRGAKTEEQARVKLLNGLQQLNDRLGDKRSIVYKLLMRQI